MTKEEIEKIQVVSADIIVTGLKHNSNKPYYEIKYKEVGKNDYTIGYGSYNLNFVIEWLNTCFEIVGEECTVTCDYEQLYVDSINLINNLQEELDDIKAIDKSHQGLVGDLLIDVKELQRKNKKQKELLETLRPFLDVRDGKYIYYIDVKDRRLLTKEQYDLIRVWLENGEGE